MADNSRIEDLRRRVQKDPASIAFAQLAEEYRRAGRHQEAVDACTAGLGLHPGYLSARVTLGRALIELGDIDRAQRELETVLKSAPENLAAIRGMADIHYQRGALIQAHEFYRMALGLAPNDPDLEQTVGDLTQRLGAGKGPEPIDGLSLDQMQREMAARVSPAPRLAGLDRDKAPDVPNEATYAASSKPMAPTSAPPASVVDEVQTVQSEHEAVMASGAVPASDPGQVRAVRIIAALEQWLEAIDALNVARAHPPS